MLDESNIIMSVAQLIRDNIHDTLAEHGTTLDTATREHWDAIGFADDYAFFLASREDARDLIAEHVDDDHPLMVAFGKTWKRIIKAAYPGVAP
jgi:hypothetical protein